MSAAARPLWRNAATLILVAPKYPGQIKGNRAQQNDSVVGVGGPSERSQFDMLNLRRSSGNVFMPGAHVFPGGAISDQDFSREWREIFDDCGVSVENLLTQFNQQRPRPEIIEPEHDSAQDVDRMPKDIAYRICSLRETFEEAGVLLARDKQNRQLFAQRDVKPSLFSLISNEKLKQWQRDVQDNATNFVRLFRELQCYPDVASLHEWSNWLTPSSIRGRRYDTMFYLTTRSYKPDVIQDDREVDQNCWLSPEEAVKQVMSGQIYLPPPQLYETARLSTFQDIMMLEDFAKKRSVLGLERVLPVFYKTTDKIVISVLPGDTLYPSAEDLQYTAHSSIKLEQSADQVKQNQKGQPLHRMFLTSPPEVFINTKPRFGHITPLHVDTSALSNTLSNIMSRL